jgi:hypothetical protein
MKKIILPFAFICLLIACENSEQLPADTACHTDDNAQETETALASTFNPLSDLETKPAVFKINPKEAKTIELPSGSSITIPANAIVDENGNPIDGEVEITWNEYHSVTDQILSGISMKYDSAGVTHDFLSGGMFTIKGFHEGKPVFIAEDKAVQVDLASISPQEQFNFYEQDEESGAWSYITTQKDQAVPASRKTNYVTFDVRPKNLKDFEELKGQEIVGWRTTESLTAAQQNILKKNTKYALLERAEESYSLTLFAAKDSSTFSVTPLTMEIASVESKENKAKLNQQIADIMDYQSDVSNARMIRSIQINNFATYNWDVIMKMKKRVSIPSEFEIADNESSLKLMTFYLVCLDQNYQVPIEALSGEKIAFDGAFKNAIIGINKDKELYFANQSVLNDVAQGNTGEMIPLEKTSVVINQGQDLAAFIKSLRKA